MRLRFNFDLVHLLHSSLNCFSCQVEDILPPVFSVTPKGSGAGYGVGFDLDDLLAQSLTELQHSDLRERSVQIPVTAKCTLYF